MQCNYNYYTCHCCCSKLHNRVIVRVVKGVIRIGTSRSRARARGACSPSLAFCVGQISSRQLEKFIPIGFVKLVLDSWYEKRCAPNHLFITFQVAVRSRFLAPRGSIAEFVKGECERAFCFLCRLRFIPPQFQCAANL